VQIALPFDEGVFPRESKGSPASAGDMPETMMHSSANTSHPRPNGRKRGSVLVEFALTLPLFFVLVIGMLEYGYWFYVALSATSAAREGARQCTLVSLGACGACNPSAALDYMGAIGMDGYTDADATCENDAGALMYTVDVTVDFPTLTGYLPILGVIPASATAGNTLASGIAVMRGQ
jgi:hypothetical protein